MSYNRRFYININIFGDYISCAYNIFRECESCLDRRFYSKQCLIEFPNTYVFFTLAWATHLSVPFWGTSQMPRHTRMHFRKIKVYFSYRRSMTLNLRDFAKWFRVVAWVKLRHFHFLVNCRLTFPTWNNSSWFESDVHSIPHNRFTETLMNRS